jgi:tetratricopeptide (TPR) repeat protein
MEIEADEYSGFVMFKLGASLEQAQEVIRLISTNADDSYSTHPSRNKRLKAVERGYTNADVATLTAYDYFSRGGLHSKSEEERIDNYTKCIRLEPDRFGCYYNRANTYDRLERYEDALADWTKALKITPTDLPYGKSDVLLNRGDVFFKLNKYEEAFNDYNVAMQLNKDYPKGLARAYITRGDAYLNLKKYEKALADYNKAREIINKTGLYPRGFSAPYFLVKLANTKKELMLPYCSDFKRACEIALEDVGLDAAEHKELIGNLPVGCVEYDKSCK